MRRKLFSIVLGSLVSLAMATPIFAQAPSSKAISPENSVSGSGGSSWIYLTRDYDLHGTTTMGAHSTQGNITAGAFTVLYSDGKTASGSINFWPWQHTPNWSNTDHHTFPSPGTYSATLTGHVQINGGGWTYFLYPTSAAYFYYN